MQKWQEENRNVASSHTSTLDSATEVPATKKIMRPQWLASFILSGLRNVTRMTYHTALFGTLLYERVGDIHVTIINGEEQELLLDELLQTLNPTDSGDTFGNLSREERLSYFIRLKKETQERRSRLFGEKSARYGLENMASDVA
ncbi:hypothetical protein DL96DRAFT_1596590 [Flagelloscypha sp. PMI_526]|nr:hypothetical protein DL96DRAFT_1596590 [Flagelloscypha sp. PMI_526]